MAVITKNDNETAN